METLIRKYDNTIINLSNITAIEMKHKQLSFYGYDKTNPFNVCFDTDEETKKEFNSIYKILQEPLE